MTPRPCHRQLPNLTCSLRSFRDQGCLEQHDGENDRSGRSATLDLSLRADPTFHLTLSRYTDTGPTSPSADPITPGAWQGSTGVPIFKSLAWLSPGKIPPGIFRSRGGRLNHSANEAIKKGGGGGEGLGGGEGGGGGEEEEKEEEDDDDDGENDRSERSATLYLSLFF